MEPVVTVMIATKVYIASLIMRTSGMVFAIVLAYATGERLDDADAHRSQAGPARYLLAPALLLRDLLQLGEDHEEELHDDLRGDDRA